MKGFLLSLTCAVSAAANPKLGVQVSSKDASYAVTLDGNTFFTSADYAIRYNNTLHTSSNGLNLDYVRAINGAQPALGPYLGYEVSWSNQVFITRFKLFTQLNAIIFEQAFPTGLNGTDLPQPEAFSDLASAFPTFTAPPATLPATNPLGCVLWGNCMCGASVAQWTSGGIDKGKFGREGGIGAWFNSTGATIVMSAASNFMVGALALSGSLGNALGAGLNGMVNTIPAGFTHWTLLTGGQGINDTMYAHGNILLALGGKQRTKPDADIVVSKLSYWTDNGAYYYYNTEANKTYEQSMLDVKAYLMDDLQLPIAYFQYDSWWYFKEPNRGALLLWEPMPSVFPDGLTPFLGLPVALHNRYFAPVNNYSANYTFLTEPGATVSLPIDKRLFRDIMADKVDKWGMVLYEQDWLNVVYEGMNVTQSNVTAAHDWLTAMSDAAEELGVTIQYCMPLPNHILHSTLSQPVTNARASGDYHPGQTNFQIALSSLFYWAMGIAPSKDDYWTTEVQPGNPYSDNPTEPNWQLQAIVIALSTGPNGPSDAVGKTNASLVMSTVRGDGTTLKPDRPGIMIDDAILQVLQPGGAVQDIISTWTAHADGQYRWQYLLNYMLGQNFTLTFEALGPSFAATEYAVFNYFNPSAGPIATLSPSSPFIVATGQGQSAAPPNAHTIRYHILAPVLSNGWVIYGENGKIVPMAAARFSGMTVSSSGFTVNVAGSSGEPNGIDVLLMAPGSNVVSTVTCPSAAGRSAVLACTGTTSSSCNCA